VTSFRDRVVVSAWFALGCATLFAVGLREVWSKGGATVFALVLMLAGCAGSQQGAATVEECLGPKLAEISAKQVAEAFARCAGDYEWDECPHKSEIETKYDAERQRAAKECQ
jgi:hypothetical protein